MFSISIDQYKKKSQNSDNNESKQKQTLFEFCVFFLFYLNICLLYESVQCKTSTFYFNGHFIAIQMVFLPSLCEFFCEKIRIGFFVRRFRCWFIGRKCWIQKVFENRFGNHFFRLRINRWSCSSSFRVKFIVCLFDSLMCASYVLYGLKLCAVDSMFNEMTYLQSIAKLIIRK